MMNAVSTYGAQSAMSYTPVVVQTVSTTTYWVPNAQSCPAPQAGYAYGAPMSGYPPVQSAASFAPVGSYTAPQSSYPPVAPAPVPTYPVPQSSYAPTPTGSYTPTQSYGSITPSLLSGILNSAAPSVSSPYGDLLGGSLGSDSIVPNIADTSTPVASYTPPASSLYGSPATVTPPLAGASILDYPTLTGDPGDGNPIISMMLMLMLNMQQMMLNLLSMLMGGEDPAPASAVDPADYATPSDYTVDVPVAAEPDYASTPVYEEPAPVPADEPSAPVADNTPVDDSSASTAPSEDSGTYINVSTDEALSDADIHAAFLDWLATLGDEAGQLVSEDGSVAIPLEELANLSEADLSALLQSLGDFSYAD